MKKFRKKNQEKIMQHNANKEIEILWAHHPPGGDTLHRTVLDGKVNDSRRRGRPQSGQQTSPSGQHRLECHQAVWQRHNTTKNGGTICIQPSPRGWNMKMMMKRT